MLNPESKSRELDNYKVGGVVNRNNAIVPAEIFRDSDDHPYSRDGSNYPWEEKKEVAHVERHSTHIGEVDHLHKAPFGDPSLVKGKVKADYGMEEAERRYSNMDDGPPWHPATYTPSRGFDAHEYRDEGFPYNVEDLEQYEAEVLERIEELRDKLIQTRVNRQPPSGRRTFPGNLHRASDRSYGLPELRSSSKPHTFQHSQLPNSADTSMSRHRQMVATHGEFRSDIPVATHHASSMRGPHRYGGFNLAPFSYAQYSGYNHVSLSHPHVDSGIMEFPYRGKAGGLYPMGFSSPEGCGRQKFNNTGPFWHLQGSQSRQKHSLHAPGQYKCPSLAGGTPYISCDGCLELLVLPTGLLRNRCRAKLRCGECSCILVVGINGKLLRIVDSIPADGMEDGLHQTPLDRGSADSIKCNTSGKSASTTGENVGASKLVSPDREEGSQKGCSPKSSKVHNREMDSPKEANLEVKPRHRESKEDESMDTSQKKSDANSPIHDDHVSSSHGVIKYVFGSMAGFPDENNVAEARDNHQHVSADSATELVLPPNEYPNMDLSLASLNGKKDEKESKATKTNAPFSVGLEDREQSPFHSSPEKERCRVSINGHPIHDLVVKEAEKKAGSIQPADYWYDYTAGFWGIMGQPCLGIIPPHIKEFDFAMSKNCANGDTGVIVNGRELHQADLDLLCVRGLSPTRGRSYIIDISGRVEDAISGKELKNLGKLAPTVEKLGHGFGMRPKLPK